MGQRDFSRVSRNAGEWWHRGADAAIHGDWRVRDFTLTEIIRWFWVQILLFTAACAMFAGILARIASNTQIIQEQRDQIIKNRTVIQENSDRVQENSSKVQELHDIQMKEFNSIKRRIETLTKKQQERIDLEKIRPTGD
jgi:hypothetical protein